MSYDTCSGLPIRQEFCLFLSSSETHFQPCCALGALFTTWASEQVISKNIYIYVCEYYGIYIYHIHDYLKIYLQVL